MSEGATSDLAERIARLDTTLFDHVEVQLDREDQRSLLALHSACRTGLGSFCYLEIGSHLGGSLQAFIRDSACLTIISIDSRPASQPDERGIRYRYPENTTQRMLEGLAAIPGADLGKLQTIERSTEELSHCELPIRPQLAFVDGEHTDRAAQRDARFCDAAMSGTGCIAFHDAAVVYRGVREFLSELVGGGRKFCAYVLPDSLFVIELGDPFLLTAEPVASRVRESYRAYFHALAEAEPYRTEYRRLAHRVLRRSERFVTDAAKLVSQRRASARSKRRER
jgi:hypothetical protein